MTIVKKTISILYWSLVVALVLAACNPPRDDSPSGVTSIDNLVGGAAVEDDCFGDFLNQPGSVKIDNRGTASPSSVAAVERASTAIPKNLKGFFFGALGGTIRIVKDLEQACRNSNKISASASDARLMGCFDLTNAEKPTILLRDSSREIAHETVRMFGFFLAGLSHESKQVDLDKSGRNSVSTLAALKVYLSVWSSVLTRALIQDLPAGNPLRATLQASIEQNSPQEGRLIFSEIFDSLYCSHDTRRRLADRYPNVFQTLKELIRTPLSVKRVDAADKDATTFTWERLVGADALPALVLAEKAASPQPGLSLQGSQRQEPIISRYGAQNVTFGHNWSVTHDGIDYSIRRRQNATGLMNEMEVWTTREPTLQQREALLSALALEPQLKEQNLYPSGSVDVYTPKNNIPSGYCFLAGTLVLTPDRGQVAIERLRVGDRVISYDVRAHRMAEGRVSRLMTRLAPSTGTLHLANGSVIHSTPDHPFFSATRQAFVPADQLGFADRLLLLEKAPLAGATESRRETGIVSQIGFELPIRLHDGHDRRGLVASTTAAPLAISMSTAVQRPFVPTKNEQATPVWNLTVDGQHNFFAGGVLVHNKNENGDELDSPPYSSNPEESGTSPPGGEALPPIYE